MKKLGIYITLILGIIVNAYSQDSSISKNNYYPYLFTKDYVVVGINAKTTDKQLLEIRKNILKYTSIRFTNFDVIRGKNGDIYFLSMAVDCRDGYKGDISHSFEKGDTTYYGFVRDYSLNTYKRAFYIGDLTSELSGINHVKEYLEKKSLENEKKSE
ncbi:MAG: hypothetical protein LKE30_07990 [Bacteroidales bacterium]|jgi:hypothetical protein|nr:hypothetical protein [Bacteroidales bacterium]